MPETSLILRPMPSRAQRTGYKPKTPADWTDPDPRTVQEGLDLLSSSTGAGHVVGPGSATDEAIACYDGTTGKLIKNSLVILPTLTGLPTVQGATILVLDAYHASSATAVLIRNSGPDLAHVTIDGSLTVQGDVISLAGGGNQSIVTTGNDDLFLTPGGSGDLVLDLVAWPRNDAPGSPNNYLQTNGAAQSSWVELEIANDTTPQLGGNLDVNGKTINAATLLDTGTRKINFDILTLSNDVNHADMDGTETSILFRQAYLTGTLVDAARITFGTEIDWTSTGSTRDGYLAFHTSLNGAVAEKMRIISDGRVGINCDPLTHPGASVNDFLLIHREGAGINMSAIVETSSSPGHRPLFFFRRARNTAVSPAKVESGDWLGSFVAAGHDGSAYKNVGSIEFKVDGATSTGVVPCEIIFMTGTASRTTRLTIGSDGDMLVASTNHLAFNDPGEYIYGDGSGLLLVSSGDMAFQTGGTNTRFKIHDAGGAQLISSNKLYFYDTNKYIYGASAGLYFGDGGVNIVDMGVGGHTLTILSAHGVDYSPGSDTDTDLITVNVTDIPKLWWDESEDEFATTKHLNIAGGWSGTFTNGDGATVTVLDGIITGVV